MVVNVKKKADELKIKGPDLITRTVGRDMYHAIKRMLEHMVHEEVVVLDFNGIKVIDTSFIDEFLVKLMIDGRTRKPAFYLKLKNISATAEINIDFVFKSYSNYGTQKLALVTEDICQSNNFFIGPLSDREKSIIDFIRVNKSSTTEDIVTFSGVEAAEMRPILDELHHLRLIRKEPGGLYYAV